MRTLFRRFAALLKPRANVMRVAGVQYLAAGVTLYAVDVDGRRIVLGATPHALCVLARYPLPDAPRPQAEGAGPASA